VYHILFGDRLYLTYDLYFVGIYVTLEGKAVVTFKALGETRTKEEKVVREECYVLGKNIRKRFVLVESFLLSPSLPCLLTFTLSVHVNVIWGSASHIVLACVYIVCVRTVRLFMQRVYWLNDILKSFVVHKAFHLIATSTHTHIQHTHALSYFYTECVYVIDTRYPSLLYYHHQLQIRMISVYFMAL